VVNKYGLGRYLPSFFILNKDLPLKNRRLTTMGLNVTDTCSLYYGVYGLG